MPALRVGACCLASMDSTACRGVPVLSFHSVSMINRVEPKVGVELFMGLLLVVG